MFSRANTANTFSDIVKLFPVFVSVSFGELGKQCRNRVFQKNILPLSSFSEQIQVSEFNWYLMSFVGGLLLGSIVVFHALQKVVFKGAWLRNVQKHVLLSASGQNRDTATFLSFHALPTRCFLKNFECTVCFVNCVCHISLCSLSIRKSSVGSTQIGTQSVRYTIRRKCTYMMCVKHTCIIEWLKGLS